MAEALRLYPLTTPDGIPIPLDLIRLNGLGHISFTNADKEFTIPAEVEILVLYATEDCIIALDAAATIPADETYTENRMIVPSEQILVIDKNGAEVLHAIRVSADGELWVIGVRAWQDTKKAVQFSRS